MKVKVQKLDGKASCDIELSDDVFGVEPRQDILHRVVTWQLWNRRATARPTRERRAQTVTQRRVVEAFSIAAMTCWLRSPSSKFGEGTRPSAMASSRS